MPKTCSQCKEYKLLSEFPSNKGKINSGLCRVCLNKAKRDSYGAANPKVTTKNFATGLCLQFLRQPFLGASYL